MTPERFERIERTIEFIINSQAAFDARLQESIQLYQQNFLITQQQIREVSKETGVLGHRIEDISGQIKELKDACRDLLDVSYNTIARLDRLEKPDRK